MGERERSVTMLETDSGICPFERWYQGIKDKKARQSVATKLTLLQDATYNNFKSVGEGVFEVRIFLGPGYRIYFGFVGSKIVVLLAGGDKNSQDDDIKKARGLWKEYKDETEKHQRKLTL
jgi:putative addiction module killer protein